MTKPLSVVVIALALGSFRSVVTQTNLGSVSGKLITESGQPLAGVTAIYRRGQQRIADSYFHSRPAPGEPAASGPITTGSDGSFNASGLPAGSYSLCLDSPPPLYVDHCSWGLAGAFFTIVAGSNTILKPVTITAGVRIHFLISDPQGVLPVAIQLEPIAHIGVVTTRGMYRSATLASRTGNVVELVVAIPHTVAASTSLFSRTLKFTQPTGAPAVPIAVSPPQGATDYNLSFSVSK